MADKGIENLHGAQITTSKGLVLAPGLNRLNPKQFAELSKDRSLKRFFRARLLRVYTEAVPAAPTEGEGGKAEGRANGGGRGGRGRNAQGEGEGGKAEGDA